MLQDTPDQAELRAFPGPLIKWAIQLLFKNIVFFISRSYIKLQIQIN